MKGSLSEQKRVKNRAKTGEKQGSARFRSLCEIDTLLRNQFAASGPSLQKFSQLRNQLWHRVPFRSTVTPILQLRNGCEPPKHERSHFCWESSILQDISRLRNHFLAHECHLEALYNHFAAAKPPHLKILQRAHHELTCHNRTPISAIVGHISITSRSSNYAFNISLES